MQLSENARSLYEESEIEELINNALYSLPLSSTVLDLINRVFPNFFKFLQIYLAAILSKYLFLDFDEILNIDEVVDPKLINEFPMLTGVQEPDKITTEEEASHITPAARYYLRRAGILDVPEKTDQRIEERIEELEQYVIELETALDDCIELREEIELELEEDQKDYEREIQRWKDIQFETEEELRKCREAQGTDGAYEEGARPIAMTLSDEEVKWMYWFFAIASSQASGKWIHRWTDCVEKVAYRQSGREEDIRDVSDNVLYRAAIRILEARGLQVD